MACGERKLFEFWCWLGEFAGERNFAALDEWSGVEEETAGTSEVAAAGKFQVVEFPANRETEGVVEFGALAGGKRELFEAADEPRERVFAAASRIEPALPRDVGFDLGVFFKEWNEARPDGAASALGGIVFPVIVPCDFDVSRNTADEPAGDIEGEPVLHGGAGDAGSIEVVEEREVRVSGAKFLDALVE
jgi:hypothetical protein